MRTVIGNTVFITKFGYPVDRDESGHIIQKRRRETVCYIRTGKVDDPEKILSERIVQTTSLNSKKENFSKSVGRLVAFRRAIEKLYTGGHIKEEEKELFWNDFRHQCPSTFR